MKKVSSLIFLYQDIMASAIKNEVIDNYVSWSEIAKNELKISSYTLELLLKHSKRKKENSDEKFSTNLEAFIEITKPTPPQPRNDDSLKKYIVHKPKKHNLEKWIVFSLVTIVTITLSISMAIHYFKKQSSGSVENYEVKLYGDSAYQYSGEIKDNLPNGQGKANFKDKREYEGSFSEGLRHGKGKMVFPDQTTTYDGDYVHGIAEGQGKMRYSNGYYYIGEWKNDKQNGLGTYYDSNGNELYHGLWKNGKPIDKRGKI